MQAPRSSACYNREGLRESWLCSKNLGPVHRMPEKFENAALFLRLGLPCPTIHTNPSRKRNFSKTLFKRSGGI